MDREETIQEAIERETRGNQYFILMAKCNCWSSDPHKVLAEIQHMKSAATYHLNHFTDSAVRRTVPITPPRFREEIDRSRLRTDNIPDEPVPEWEEIV